LNHLGCKVVAMVTTENKPTGEAPTLVELTLGELLSRE
jgi:hypothetical protein